MVSHEKNEDGLLLLYLIPFCHTIFLLQHAFSHPQHYFFGLLCFSSIIGAEHALRPEFKCTENKGRLEDYWLITLAVFGVATCLVTFSVGNIGICVVLSKVNAE